MAKKIVRGITDVKTINNQDFDTNNVNDLLSDGQYNYIHRKKGENEEYHNLTDNIKTLSSDNTELLSVTNYNKTTNTALLSPKHDAQKEQVLESTRNTITIHHGENGTAEKTTVDTNPEKVLEHTNLFTDYGISKTTTGNTTTLGLEYTKVADGFDLNSLETGNVRGEGLVNTPNNDGDWFFVSSIALAGGSYATQEAVKANDPLNTTYKRSKNNGFWGEWREQVGDKSTVDALLAQKEQVIESTRNTITINRGDKTKVDTNPQKVLEHENLISDSEYITLNHETGENTTHIQTAALKEKLDNLQQTKQDTLVAGSGISIQGQTISYSGATSTIQQFSNSGDQLEFIAIKHDVTSEDYTLTTLSFECFKTGECVLTGELEVELKKILSPYTTVSNGAVSIENNVTTIKLINTAPSSSQGDSQQGTFTFYYYDYSGGEGGSAS